jgi:hypothetical protein
MDPDDRLILDVLRNAIREDGDKVTATPVNTCNEHQSLASNWLARLRLTATTMEPLAVQATGETKLLAPEGSTLRVPRSHTETANILFVEYTDAPAAMSMSSTAETAVNVDDVEYKVEPLEAVSEIPFDN